MASRLKLHEELCELLGTRNVYFQPPESIKLKYPCIVYSLSGVTKRNADDRLYNGINQYQVVSIEIDPDGDISMKLLEKYPMCSFNRGYVVDNLNQKDHTLYY